MALDKKEMLKTRDEFIELIKKNFWDRGQKFLFQMRNMN